MYCAIIGDIIDSKKIDDRKKVQNTLNTILDMINNKYKTDIKSKFIITLGDEFQGLLSRPDNVMEIVDMIKHGLNPTKIRIGIGIGEIKTDIHIDKSMSSDGPAYYAARDAIESIRKMNKKYEQSKSDIKIFEYGEVVDRLGLVNATLSLCYFIEKGWSQKQREVIKMLLENNNNTQMEIADKLGINKSSVQRRITSSGYNNFSYAYGQIKKTLLNLWEEEDGK